VTTLSRREPAVARFDRPAEATGWLPTLFEELSFGLVVMDREGLILTANRRAREVLFPHESRSKGLGSECCEWICEPLNRQGGDAKDSGCMTQRALATDGPLPETRLEVEIGGVRNPVWITACPINCGEARVAIYLRPEQASSGDRRSPAADRAESPASSSAELRIHTLGRTRVEIAGSDFGGDWLQQRPGQVLEFLLCARHRVATSEQISEALWPGAAQPWSNASVRHQVHMLREKLEPERDSNELSRFVVTRRGGYMMDPERVWIDADEFEDKARTGLSLFVQGEGDAAMAPLERALALYQGDFLSEDPYAEWALEERDRLRELAGRELRALISLRRSAGDLDAATEYARRLAGMEPFDMDVQREFLELCIKRGRRSEAIRRYTLIRRRVRREFGHDPDFTLADLGS
jgi:DNA-binding SARP family transcriptional activator